MKSLFLALTLVSSVSFAGNDMEFNCHSSFGQSQNGPIKGHTLTITKVFQGLGKPDQYRGTLYPICLTCRVIPTILQFPVRVQRGTVLTFAGPQGRLSIAIESLMPTLSHSAQLQIPSLNNGQPISFVCTSEM